MKIRFWGVRGSIAVPGANTIRYGGNTTCIEVRTDDNDLIILDGGTGIFQLGNHLLKHMPIDAHVFMTHTHWDHIQGLPMFTPIFIPGNKLNIYGAFDPVSGTGIEKVMDIQLQYSFFPVREAELKADIEYKTMRPGQTVTVGNAEVTGTLLNHPVINFGYRVEHNGKSMFFTGDHEPPYNFYEPGDPHYEEFESIIKDKEREIIGAMRGVDVLVADSSYTLSEYPAKKGYGHGTFDSSIRMAREAGVSTLICTHHEPTRSDDELEAVFAEVLSRHPHQQGDPEIILSREGLEFEF
ncbi:MAG: MBL fold metallo-hydrolase [Methylophilaceae bacterium]